MTAAEFAALARIMPGAPGLARAAAYRVLVDGAGILEAARDCGVTPGAVCRAVARLREIQLTGCPTCQRPIPE